LEPKPARDPIKLICRGTLSCQKHLMKTRAGAELLPGGLDPNSQFPAGSLIV